MKTITNTNALAAARALGLPTREASLKREASVSQFWKSNRNLLEEAWAEWEKENKDNLLVPDETLLDPRLRQAVNEAWGNPEKENAVADLWEEIIPGVYSAQFFDLERLAEFRTYLEAVVNSQIPKRAPYGIQLNRYGMMLDPRSEGHLAAPNFQTFYNEMMDRYMRPIARLLLGTYGYDNQTFGFSIQYNPDKDKDLHATHPITSGQRSNLVVWLYGDRMQIPRGSTSSYGSVGNSSSKVVTEENITARQRWSVPDGPKDTIAPF